MKNSIHHVEQFNDDSPCWCGSNLPFAHCHKGREDETRVPTSEIIERYKRARTRSSCLHFDAGPYSCSRPFIRAHSIQRKRGLDRIARGGKVYRFSADFSDLIRENGLVTAKLIGINQISTFMGFCSFHDNALFEPIDKYSFEASEDRVALYAYRALTRELWVRENALSMIPFFRTLDRGRSLAEQQGIQSLLDAYEGGLSNGHDNLLRHKCLYDKCLCEGRFDEFRYVAFVSDNAPDVLCSGVIYPEYDFQGETLQDLSRADLRRDLLSFSAIATDSGSAYILAWHASSDSACKRFIGSLASVPEPENEIGEAVMRLILSACENLAVRPDWWEGLPEETRDFVLARFQYIGHPFTPPYPQHLMPNREEPRLAPAITYIQTNV